jgi:hypothetical protein
MDKSNKFFTTLKISENIQETPEGFLVCHDVPIARAGDLLYLGNETTIEPGEGGLVILTRTIEELSRKETLASFEGKSIVIGHPDPVDGEITFVDPDNWKNLTVGILQNVRVGGGGDEDKLIADLLITDREAIDAVKEKKLRQLSCGYSCTTTSVTRGYGIQTDFIGNHISLEKKGRCGNECAIFDQAPKFNRGLKMNLKKKFIRILGKAMDQMPELDEVESSEEDTTTDVMTMLAKINLRLDALEKEKMGDDDISEDDYMMEEGIASDEEGGSNEKSLIIKKLEVIEEVLMKLLKDEDMLEDECVEIEVDPDRNLDLMLDSSILSKAEILAPGIRKSKDIKKKALKHAYKTVEGRKAINSLLDGKTIDSVDTGLLFNAAAAALKDQRRDSINATRFSSNLPINRNAMSAADINLLNAKRWAAK